MNLGTLNDCYVMSIFFSCCCFSFWRNYANHFDLISVIGGDFTIKITTYLSNETIFDRKA